MTIFRKSVYPILLFVLIASCLVGCDKNPVTNENSAEYDVYIVGMCTNPAKNDTMESFLYKNNERMNFSTFEYEAPQIAVSGNDIYIVGVIANYYFKNGDKVMLSGIDPYAECVTVSGADIFMGGSDNDKPCYWKNNQQFILPSLDTTGSLVQGIAVSGNNVYCSGLDFGSTYGVVCYWKNGVLYPLDAKYSRPWDIAASGNDFHLVGRDTAGSPFYLKNGIDIDLHQRTAAGEYFLTAIEISGRDIYCAGTLYRRGYQGQVFIWKNNEEIFLSDTSTSSHLRTMTVADNNVLIGGQENDIPCYWKNGKKMLLDSMNTDLGSVTGIAVVRK